MSTRYENRRIVVNDNKLYKNTLKTKGLSYIRQFTTGQLPKIRPAQIQQLDLVPHVWGVGDRFYKLAHRFYGDTSMWWVIAWFNKIPTEQHAKKGQVILIPKPIGKVLTYLGNDTYGRL